MSKTRPLGLKPRIGFTDWTHRRQHLITVGQTHALLIGMVLLALATRLGFWLYTGRIWEDALITTTHALSAVDGLGLTHHLGEGRVHGFTSAVSVLIPWGAELAVRGTGLIALKLAALLASVFTLIYADGVARRLGLGLWPRVFLLAYLACDYNQIFYGMGGMETQAAVATIFASLFYLLKQAPLLGGLWLGLSLLARPDFVLWVFPVLLAFWLYRLRTGAIATLATAAVFGPWLLFTTLYYGSFVPHSALAKSISVGPPRPAWGDGWGIWWAWLGERLAMNRFQFWRYFVPFYEKDSLIVHGPIQLRYAVIVAFVLLGLALWGIWSQGRQRWLYPAIAYLALFTLYWILLLPGFYFAWYLPPYMGIWVVFVAAGLQRTSRAAPRLARALALGLALLYACHIPFTYPLDAREQQQIENAVRQPLGDYLGSVMQPGEAVVAEPAGYIGYYSRALLYDWPGLTSPTMVAVMKALPREQRTMSYGIARLEPAWLALRPAEMADLQAQFPEVAQRYRLVKQFKTEVELRRWGISYWNIDREFSVWRRGD